MIRVLFVCVENSNRSQMAEAFARIHGDERVAAYSAGSNPSGTVNSRAVRSMAAVGYDLGSHRSKSLDELPAAEFDVVVTMGCGDACPNVRARQRFDWEIPDPRDLPPAEFDVVRDRIESEVKHLLSSLGVSENPANE